jgi:hypothetical protein
LSPSTAPDSDGDGLTDDAEEALGVSPVLSDSDRDGISDLAELEQGLDPLGGRTFPTGVVASLPLRGEARGVVVEGSILDGQRQTAYVATGPFGLAIVDASRFNNPVVLGQLDLSGDSIDVAVDSRLGIAAVAGKSGGLHLVDVSDPMMPRLLQTIPVLADQVEIFEGVAYVATATDVRGYDILTGERLGMLALPGAGNVSGLARERDKLYGFRNGSDLFFVLDISSGGEPLLVGQLPVENQSNDVAVAVGNGIAYLTGGGMRTVDVSDPANPQLMADAQAFFTNRGMALNGSDLALTASEIQGVGVYDVRDPSNTNAFLTSIDTPGFANQIAIGAGIGFVADGNAGLHVVNYLSFDNLGQPPSVAISLEGIDQDPGAPGIQVAEGASIPVNVQVDDDVQVRNVELLVDDGVVRNDVSFPFDFSPVAVGSTRDAASVTVQVRATDTGGNSTLSDPLVLELVPDSVAPSIVQITPAEGTLRHGLERFQVTFSEALAAATVTAENFQLRDGQGNAVPLRDIQLRSRDRTVQLIYDPLPEGDYTLTIDAARITDRAGNGGTAEAVVQAYHLVNIQNFWTGAVNTDWTNPGNWSTGAVPGPNDDVTVDLPGRYTININSDVVIGSLSLGGIQGAQTLATNRALFIDGDSHISGNGALNLSGSAAFTFNGELEVEGTLSRSGGSLGGPGTLAVKSTGRLNVSGAT